MTLKETLLAYSQQQAPTEAVMRALVSHDGWLVEAGRAVNITGGTHFEKGHILGTAPTNIRAGELWYYTDVTAANQAVAGGASLGYYVGNLPGTQVFAATPESCQTIRINPGCEREITWFLDRKTFSQTALWAQAIALEARLDEPNSPEKFAAMRAYVGYLLLIVPEHDAFATAMGMGGLKNPAMVFTAIDCLQAVTRSYPHLKQHVLSGEKLFAVIQGKDMDGVGFNPFGPGPRAVFDLADCARILAAGGA